MLSSPLPSKCILNSSAQCSVLAVAYRLLICVAIYRWRQISLIYLYLMQIASFRHAELLVSHSDRASQRLGDKATAAGSGPARRAQVL